MNRIHAESPDYVIRRIAIRRDHPCAHKVTGANGLVTITFIHNMHEGICLKCHQIMPLTFWQFSKSQAELLPA